MIIAPTQRDVIVAGALGMFLLLGAAQAMLRRQRRPVWTTKAITVTGTAAILGAIAAVGLTLARGTPLLLLLPLAQPFTLACAWLLWRPVDAVLKRRILDRARRLREAHPDLIVIGVTGSVGKTTTKELLACALNDLQPNITPAHVNSEIGVARWLANELRTTNDELRTSSDPSSVIRHPLFIIEMGAYRTGEIKTLCTFTQPTLGVITHVGSQHIALFGSQQSVREAKSELIRALPPDGRAFLNGDNDLARSMAALSPCPATIVGTGGSCDLEACDIEETARGIRFRLAPRSPGEEGARDIVFDVPLPGTHNVTNVLLAIAVGEHLGIAAERMRDLLRGFTPLSRTFSIRTEAGVRILDDTHNSSVASLKAAIAWARTQPEAHKVLLTAGLIEMGDLQSPAEQELAAMAGTVFTRIVVIDPQSARNFAAGTASGIETFSRRTPSVPPGALLVCTGRMPPSSIKQLLPDIRDS